MPKSYVVSGTEYQFPDTYSDEQVHGILVKQGVISPPKNQTWAETMGMGNPTDVRAMIGKGVVDLAEGAAAGLASTVYHGGDILRRMTGAEHIIDKPEVQQAMTAPPTLAGKAGKFAEQTAEFMIPGTAVTKGLKGAGLAANMLGQAAIGGAVGGLQSGGEPVGTALAAGLGAAGPVVEKAIPAIAQVLKESAVRGYSQFLNPTKIFTKAGAAQVVPELLDREVKAFTLKGFRDKAASAADRIGTEINVKWGQLPPGTVADSAKLTADIDTAIGEHYIKGVLKSPEAKTAVTALTGLRDTVEQLSAGGKIDVQDLLKLRRYWDGIVRDAGGFGKPLADLSKAQAHKEIANSAREILNSEHPDIAALNREFNLYKTAEDVATATIERRTGQAKSLGRKMTSAAAAAVGFGTAGVHGAIGGKMLGDAIEAAVESGAWKTISAVYKNKLADALANGNKAGMLFYLGKIQKSALQASATSQ